VRVSRVHWRWMGTAVVMAGALAIRAGAYGSPSSVEARVMRQVRCVVLRYAPACRPPCTTCFGAAPLFGGVETAKE
jgi:hypothetical protein